MKYTRTLGVLVATVATLAVFVFGFYLNLTRKTMDQSVSDASLYQIRHNLGVYLDVNHCLPAAHSIEHSFPHSWRSQLVRAQLGNNRSNRQIDFEQPWTAKFNVDAAKVHSNSFRRGEMSAWGSNIPTTDFFVVVGTNTAFPYDHHAQLSDIHDGLANTVLVIETVGSNIPWTKPADVEFSGLEQFYDGNGFASLDVRFPDGPGLIFADLAVYRMKRRLPFEIFRSLFTVSGQERWTRAQLVDEGFLVKTYPSPHWFTPDEWSDADKPKALAPETD